MMTLIPPDRMPLIPPLASSRPILQNSFSLTCCPVGRYQNILFRFTLVLYDLLSQ